MPYSKYIHTDILDRMPVIFGNKESSDLWLNGSPSFNFDTMLKPYEESDLVRALNTEPHYLMSFYAI